MTPHALDALKEQREQFWSSIDALLEENASLRSELNRLSAQGGEVPEPSEIDAAWGEYVSRYTDMLSDEPDADLEVFSAGFRAGASRVRPAPPHPDTVEVSREEHHCTRETCDEIPTSSDYYEKYKCRLCGKIKTVEVPE